MVWIIVTLLICAYESLTKGWFSFILLPISVVALPLELLLQLWARRAEPRHAGSDLKGFRTVQLVAFLMSYVTIVGIGDTEQVYLFGLWTVDLHSAWVTFSSALWVASVITLPIATLFLIIRLLAPRAK